MTTIPLHDVYYFLKQCRGVLLEGRFVELFLSEIEDNYDSVFLNLEWIEYVDGEEVFVCVSFNEGNNQTAAIIGSTLILTNVDGEEEELILLKEWSPQLIN
jgi:hypothetical protein